MYTMVALLGHYSEFTYPCPIGPKVSRSNLAHALHDRIKMNPDHVNENQVEEALSSVAVQQIYIGSICRSTHAFLRRRRQNSPHFRRYFSGTSRSPGIHRVRPRSPVLVTSRKGLHDSFSHAAVSLA